MNSLEGPSECMLPFVGQDLPDPRLPTALALADARHRPVL